MTSYSSIARFTPPRPQPLPPIASLARTIVQGEGDLLSLLPANAYTSDATFLGYSRRSILLVNEPSLVRQVMLDVDEIFPKSDLMVNALESLIGNSIFVSSGETWRRQRAMIDPAFSMMRLGIAFTSMKAAVDDHVARIKRLCESGEAFSLDLFMSHLAADIICRTVFSIPLDDDVARDVFDDFVIFERDVAQVKVWRLIVDPAWKKPVQSSAVLGAAQRIRDHLGKLIDTHLEAPDGTYNDIASAVIAARDTETGEPFTREELIDQLGVFFLAGHETTASALSWLFYFLASEPSLAKGLRYEVEGVVGDDAITFQNIKSLVLAKSVFFEALRLYPPITFMPRVAMKPTKIGEVSIRRGALVMIAPWTTHRHMAYWSNPDEFQADRFLPPNDKIGQHLAFFPFGSGPHTCIGAGFAQIESVLIIAELIRQFEFEIVSGQDVHPVARLTTRPVREIKCRVKVHG
ncbi:MAG: cytochrome P450 [Pseudomonadota bacterium]